MKNTVYNKAIGNAAEEKASQYLINKGYRIVSRNYHSRYGEIDIIADLDEYIIFAEVKYRRTNVYGTPSLAVGYAKQQKIKKTALTYIGNNNISNKSFRFDIIEILGFGNINHIINAFY